MRSINRVAIVVRPRQAFFDWARSLEGEEFEKPESWCSVYLVDAPAEDEPHETLMAHFQRVFEEQLESWYTDRRRWPSTRTFETFQNWFDAEFGDLVFDLSDDEPIEYDD